jgi:[acyl-carrier-protein] S-malonyltransferase
MIRSAIFPGQGAQHVAMGKDLHDAFPKAAELFRRADEVLDLPLSETCFTAPTEVINRTDICQPAIFLVSAATIEVLEEEKGLDRTKFSAAAGLSLGEYSALWFAGALDFEDALALTRLRGRLMQEASEAQPSGMVSVLGLSREQIEEVCAETRNRGGIVCVANLNSPGQVVISGARDALEKTAERLKELGAKRTLPLAVAGAFHSPLMAPAAERLKEKLAATEIRPAGIPVIANVNAEPVTKPDEVRENLVRQLTNPVLWEASMRRLIAEGCRDFLEPGPGRVLAGLMRKIERDATVEGYPDAAAIAAEGREG